MGLLGKIIKITLYTATLPIDMAKDALTLGGTLIDEESATAKKIRKINKDVDSLDKD